MGTSYAEFPIIQRGDPPKDEKMPGAMIRQCPPIEDTEHCKWLMEQQLGLPFIGEILVLVLGTVWP